MWILTVTDEISGLKRVHAYRWKWLAELRSAFVAFPSLRRARYTRVKVAPMPE